MIKKIARIFIIFLGFIFLVIFAAAVSLRLAFPDAKLKTLAQDGIRGFISRESTFGKVHLGVTGIEIEDFTLSELPNFKAGTFLSVKRISFRPGLISGKAMGELIIDSPKIHLASSGPDSWNFSDISALRDGRPESRKYSYFPAFSSVKVTNGEIIFSGKNRGLPDVSATKIFIDISPGGAGTEFSAGLKADVLSGSSRLELDSELTYDATSRVIQVKRSAIRQGQKLMAASGYFKDCFSKGKRAEFDFNVAGDRAVLDIVINNISKNSGVQFGAKEMINVEIAGTADEFKIKGK